MSERPLLTQTDLLDIVQMIDGVAATIRPIAHDPQGDPSPVEARLEELRSRCIAQAQEA